MKNLLRNIQCFVIIFAYICFLVFGNGCEMTPDPNYLPINPGNESLAPWDAEIYSAEEMLANFADTNYNMLTKVFVSLNGNNNGDGSEQAPYRSIQKAIDESPETGVLVCVRAGVYTEGTINIIKHASREEPFVIYSFDGPGLAILDGEDKTEDLVRMNGEHNVIDGFTIRNCNGFGVSSFSPIENNEWGNRDRYAVIRNNTIYKTGRDGVKCGNNNFILIEYNDISDVKHLVQPDDCIDGVGVYHTICRYNYLHDNGNGTGGYFKGGSTNNIWYGNLIENCGGTGIGEIHGAGINLGGWGRFAWRDNQWYEYPAGYEQMCYNNIFVNCPSAGITIGSAQQCYIYNNTFYNCAFGDIGKWGKTMVRILEPDNVPSKNIHISNNIVFNEEDKPFEKFFDDYSEKYVGGGIKHGFNSIYSAGADLVWGYENEETEKIEDCLLVAPENGDFSLSATSPAINSAETINAIKTDFFNKTRTGNYDRGAVEY